MSGAPECPSSEALAVFSAGGASDQLGAEIRTHLDRCEVCRRASSALVKLQGGLAETRPADAEPVTIAEEIGRGGMGVVYRGVQRSLSRDVAIKTIPLGAGDAEVRQLVAEAQVTGALEHPSIVPIYGLARDDDGRPLVLMKHLAGESWQAGLADRGDRGAAADIEPDIRILIHVCNAVAFAHSRGVIHRDIKPANILLGDFGEVYLVDWGLAASVGDVAISGLPRAEELEGATGSVLYMAPEQAAGKRGTVGVATDVYLLGATLYELITGSPIRERDGADLAGLVESAIDQQPPQLPDWVPGELAAICRRALANEPGERFDSVTELRDALDAFLERRSSRELEDEGRRRLERAAARADLADEETGRDLFAARFAFEQALRSWPENPRAAAGRSRAIALAAEREIAAGRPESAELLIDELGDAGDAALEVEVAALRDRLDARRARVEALERAALESDLGVAIRLWRGIGTAFGLTLLVAHVALAALDHAGLAITTHLIYLAVTSATAAAFAIPVFARRAALFPNRASVRYVFTLAAMLLAQVVVFAFLWKLEIALATTLAISLFQLAGSLAIKTALFDRRALWTAPVAALCGAVATLAPQLAIECTGAAYAIYFIAGSQLRFDGDRPSDVLEDLRPTVSG